MSEYSSAFRTHLKHSINNQLISVDFLPPAETVDAIYVLGGSQESLEVKFQTVARLFHSGRCNNILILHKPGITEYSHPLGRNLTNDEWSIMNLNKLGVTPACVEPVKIKEGFFGTFSEAKGISDLVKKRKYKSIILITTPCHTNRVKISFSEHLKGQSAIFYVQGSDERLRLTDLITEYIKLIIYKHFLVSE